MSEWQPIETAPADGTNILAIQAGDHVPVVAAIAQDDQWIERGMTLPWFKPTHWMPIPAPPVPEDPVHSTRSSSVAGLGWSVMDALDDLEEEGVDSSVVEAIDRLIDAKLEAVEAYRAKVRRDLGLRGP